MENNKLIYYLHGDKKQDDIDLFYCDYHNLIVSLKHFYKNCQCDNDYNQYQQSLKRWKNKLKNKTQGNYYRPLGIYNYFK